MSLDFKRYFNDKNKINILFLVFHLIQVSHSDYKNYKKTKY